MSKNTRRGKKRQFKFGKVLGKNLKAEFSDEQITDSGGIQVISKIEEKRRFIDGFSSCIPDWRKCPEFCDYSIEHLVAQRVSLICAGYEDVIDSNFKREDLAFSLFLSSITGNPNLASQATVTNFENSISEATLTALHQWFLKNYMERKDRPTRIILDPDGSSIPTYGNQEKTAYHGYYQTNQYFPLFIYDHTGRLISCRLRPGTEDESKIIVSELERIVPQLREKWPGIKITVRADAGVYHPEICDWCEDNDVYYLIRIAKPGSGGGSLFTESKATAETAARRFRRKFGTEEYVGTDITRGDRIKEIKEITDKKEKKKQLKRLEKRIIRHYTFFNHRAGKGGKDPKQWRQERRIVCVCTHTDWGGERTFFVTNLLDHPEDLIKLYNQRGEAELHIKSMKALQCTRLSCMTFNANQYRLLLHGLAYLFMFELKRRLPKKLKHFTIASIQKRIIKIPALITCLARDFVIQWSENYQWKKELFSLLHSIDRMKPLQC